jgi:hypothetical protein
MNYEQQNFLLKSEINILIDNILKQEDELNKYLNSKDNQSLLLKISRNNQRIESLSNLIKKETKIAEDKTNILKEEIFGFQQEISKLNEPKVKYKQKDLEQNLIKEKFLMKTIGLHENEFNQVNENLKILKEEKIMVSNELINLMNLRENYEDIIKMRAKYIFKIRKKNPLIKKDDNNLLEDNEENKENLIDLNLNENTNININDIKIEYHDILNITSINKLCNFIYKIIATNIVSNFSSLLIELNIKNIIFLCIENAFNKYINNDPNNISNKISNFIREISVNIVNYNIKISNLFIEPQFEILLKCIFKLFSIEKTINDELKFVNNDYTFNKNILKNKKAELEKKINECSKQRSELDVEKNKIENDCNLEKNYLNKINELKEIKNLKEIEIKKINEELNLALSIYQDQINGLKQENINMENKYKNNDFKYKIENINQQIEFLFKGIKSKINGISDINQKDEFIRDMIQDINNCLESNNNININIHSFSNNKLLNIEDDVNIKSDYIDMNAYEKDDENEESSENELLSSYNSASLNNQKPTIYFKKKGKKQIKSNFQSEFEKDNTNKINNTKFKVNNDNSNNQHRHYLKLSECLQLNN